MSEANPIPQPKLVLPDGFKTFFIQDMSLLVRRGVVRINFMFETPDGALNTVYADVHLQLVNGQPVENTVLRQIRVDS